MSSNPHPRKDPAPGDAGAEPLPKPTPHPRAEVPDASYRRSFLDRRGPDGGVALRALSYALPIFALAAIFFHLLGQRFHLNAVMMVLLVLLGATIGTMLMIKAILRVSQGAGDVIRFTVAGGSSTPYEAQFSEEESLVMRGRTADALRAYEAVIAAPPRGVDPAEARLRAAAVYASSGGDPRRAAELLREVQRLHGVKPGQDIYASNRLVDLLIGPLGEPRRALVELRRLIERYPNSTAAHHARMALAKLKLDIEEG